MGNKMRQREKPQSLLIKESILLLQKNEKYCGKMNDRRRVKEEDGCTDRKKATRNLVLGVNLSPRCDHPKFWINLDMVPTFAKLDHL